MYYIISLCILSSINKIYYGLLHEKISKIENALQKPDGLLVLKVLELSEIY